MSGARHRRAGDRIEREIVARHVEELAVKSERVPLSGASRYKGNGADIDVYVFGPEEAPVIAEVKSRKNGEGFATLERWLGENDALFLRRHRSDPMILLPWKTWAALLARVRR